MTDGHKNDADGDDIDWEQRRREAELSMYRGGERISHGFRRPVYEPMDLEADEE